MSYFAQEHTGELELRLQAPNLPALFREAARALAELTAGDAAQPASAHASTFDGAQAGLDVTVELRAADRDALLVDWLDELIFLGECMGTASYVLVGTDIARTQSFSSACHGAGRAMSRGAAKRAQPGHEVRKQLEARGIVVRSPSNVELAEEAPLAYKDVERVVDVVQAAGIARKVARLRPLGVVKG